MYNSISQANSNSPACGSDQQAQLELEDRLLQQQLLDFQRSMSLDSEFDLDEDEQLPEQQQAQGACSSQQAPRAENNAALLSQIDNLEQIQLFQILNQANSATCKPKHKRRSHPARPVGGSAPTSTAPTSSTPVARPVPVSSSTASTPTTASTGASTVPSTFDVRSWADPYITSTINGNTASQTNMNSIPNLVNASSSIVGGYQVSTTTASANANGVTYNQTATIQLDNNAQLIDTYNPLNNTQSAVFVQGSSSQALTPGSSVYFANQGTIEVNNDGSLEIRANGPNAAFAQTYIGTDGTGLDVESNGANAFITGYAANIQPNQSSSQTS